LSQPARRWWRDPHVLAVAGIVLLTAPLGVRSRALWVGDETRDAAIARSIGHTHRFWLPELAGRAVPEKPPFFYLLVALSNRFFGLSPAATRLPSILLSAAAVVAAAIIARRLFSPRAGALAAAILATTYLFVVNAHDVIVDVALTAEVVIGVALFFRASRLAGHPRWGPSFGLAAGAALLTKGFVGPALLLALTVPFWFLAPERPPLSRAVSAGAMLFPCVALAGWAGALAAGGGLAAVGKSLLVHQLGRFVGMAGQEYSHHNAPVFFYVAALPGILFPWSMTLPTAIVDAVRRRGVERTLAAGIGLALVFLSIAGTKRTVYFLPVVPIVAVFTAGWIDRQLTTPLRSIAMPLRLQAGAIGVAAALVPLIPALADRRLTTIELAVVGSVGVLAAALFIAARDSRALVVTSLVLAIGSLVLLDRFSLPRLKRDEATAAFFARVSRRVPSGGRLYAFRLNEDVLGRACLDLPISPRPEDEAPGLEQSLRDPDSFVLAEPRKITRVPQLAAELDRIETGVAGSRPVGLYARRENRVPDTYLK
jgi:4-amino-4-deoxy-L-arabinose transferase-like glycosyltransferase